ncbi:MAG: hypothetical protein U0893_27270 [Chloroflexota bacterium]
MYRAIVTVQRYGDPASHDLEVPAEIGASELAATIASAMGWDEPGDGQRVVFEIEALPPGRRLAHDETLASANAWDGSWLVLHQIAVHRQPTAAPNLPVYDGVATDVQAPAGTIWEAPTAGDGGPPTNAGVHRDSHAPSDTATTAPADGLRPASNPPSGPPSFDETYLVLPERMPAIPSGLLRQPPAPLVPPADLPNVTTSPASARQPPAPSPTVDPVPSAAPAPTTPLPDVPSSPLVGWRRVSPDTRADAGVPSAAELPRPRPGADGPLRGWSQLPPAPRRPPSGAASGDESPQPSSDEDKAPPLPDSTVELSDRSAP